MQKVNLNPNTGKGKVVVAQNIQKVSERIDIDGNVIDPRTKVIIRPATAEITEQNNESILRG
jgi:hypothetical protein